jgi:hypothetical protein
MRSLLFLVFIFSKSALFSQITCVIEELHDSAWGSVNEDIEVGATLRNIGSEVKRYKVKSQAITLVGSSETFFCWTLCYAPNVTDSPGFIELNPGEATTAFKGYYRPNGSLGIGVVRYTFYNINNPSDTADFTAYFDASLAGIETSDVVNTIYPNPANESMQIRFSQQHLLNSIEIVNTVGQTMDSININNSNGSIAYNTGNLPSGFYFCRFYLQDGKTVIVEKFIVRH